MAKACFDNPLPPWVQKWMVINAGFLLFDGAFCVLRPASMGDGWIGKLYYPYRIYTDVDKNYANPDDAFVWAQGLYLFSDIIDTYNGDKDRPGRIAAIYSSGNLIECMLCLMVFFNCLGTIRRSKLLAFGVSVMTFWKTILFMLYSLDFAKGGKAAHDWPRELVLVYGLGAIWIVVPACVIYKLLQDFGWAEGTYDNSSSKSNEDVVNGKRYYDLRNRRT